MAAWPFRRPKKFDPLIYEGLALVAQEMETAPGIWVASLWDEDHGWQARIRYANGQQLLLPLDERRPERYLAAHVETLEMTAAAAPALVAADQDHDQALAIVHHPERGSYSAFLACPDCDGFEIDLPLADYQERLDAEESQYLALDSDLRQLIERRQGALARLFGQQLFELSETEVGECVGCLSAAMRDGADLGSDHCLWFDTQEQEWRLWSPDDDESLYLNVRGFLNHDQAEQIANWIIEGH